MPAPVYLDDEGNPLPGKPAAPAAAPTYLDDQGNPIGPAPAKSVLATPPPAPGFMTLAGDFLGGTPGGTGGLREQLPSPSGVLHMFTSPFETGRGIAKQAVDRYHESEARGYSEPLALATGIPIIGPAAAATGEALATGDPRKMASGAGSATGLLAPFLLPKAIGTAAKSTGADEAIASHISKGVVKSYARALNAPTAKLAKTALEVAPTLAGEDLTAMTSASLARKITSKVREAGQAVDSAIDTYKDLPINKDEILNRIDAAKNPHINPITGEPRSEVSLRAVQAYEDLKNQTSKNLGPNPTVKDLVAERRALDKEIVGNKAAWNDVTRSGKVSYQKDVANILRDTLNDVHPDIAKANANFSEWMDAKRVSQAGEAKKAAGEVMASNALGGPGVSVRGGLGSFAVKAFDILRLKNNSAAWNTLSGSTKNILLGALRSGEITPAVETALQAGLVAAQEKKRGTVYFPSLAKSAKAPGIIGAPPPVQTPSGLIAQQTEP